MFMVITTLLLFLLASRLASQDPFRLAMDIGLVLDGNTAKMAEDVLHLGISVAASVTAEVVNRLHADEDVVDHGDNDSHTNGVSPDDDHSDDGSLGAVSVTSERVNRVDEVELFGLTAGEPA
jgi:hypothetical protein